MYFLSKSKTINSRIQCRVIYIQNAINFFSTFYYVIYVDTEKQRSNNRPFWDAGFDSIDDRTSPICTYCFRLDR